MDFPQINLNINMLNILASVGGVDFRLKARFSVPDTAPIT